jgi:hypothetical protein
MKTIVTQVPHRGKRRQKGASAVDSTGDRCEGANLALSGKEEEKKTGFYIPAAARSGKCAQVIQER